MLVKKRSEPHNLMVIRSLMSRMNLSEKEKYHYFNLEKGYEGEVKFDQLSQVIHEERHVLNDLLFEINHSYFQIDTLIISRGTILLVDIKNFEGDCYLKGDKLFSVKSNWEYNNPINQSKRCETLFSQMLQHLKYTYLIESSLVFVNPTFTLYQAPMDLPIVLPSQVSRFINNLEKTPTHLLEKDNELAQKLLSLHQPKNPFHFLPDYSYDLLKKGVYCSHCKSYHLLIRNFDFVCLKCGEHEKVRRAVLRNIKEFQLLFPEQKITTDTIYDWCDSTIYKRTIRRVLKEHFTAFGKNNGTYYEMT